MLHVSCHLSPSFIASAHGTSASEKLLAEAFKNEGRPRMSTGCDETGTMRMQTAGLMLAHFVYRGPLSNRKDCYVFRFRFFAYCFTDASNSGSSLRYKRFDNF
jgi:hypothetical protein